MKRTIVLSIVLTYMRALGATTPVGAGGDKDPATFTFRASGKCQQLVTADGAPIKPDQVKSFYGKEFKILCDGVDVCSVEYTWKKGFGCDQPVLKPTDMDLSKWESIEVEPGFVGIDPVLGRFKFSKGNTLSQGELVRFVKRVQLGNYAADDPILRGDYVFTVNGEETRGIQAVNVSDPENLRYAGYAPMTSYSSALALGKDYAYIKGGSQTLGIADIRDPEDIKLVKVIPAQFGYGRMTVHKDRLYLTSYPLGVVVYDLTDADDPLLTHVIDITGIAEVKAAGEYLYLLKSSKEKGEAVIVVELGQGEAWKEVGRLEFPEDKWGRGLVYADSYLYFGDDKGLRIVDVRNPEKPVLAATYEELKVLDYNRSMEGGGLGLADIVKDGNHLYVSASRSEPFAYFADFPPMANLKDEDIPERKHLGGIWILDVSDPAKPQLTGRIDDIKAGTGNPSRIAGIDKGRLYVLCPPMGLVGFDVSDLKNIKRLGRISLYGEVENAELIGDKLYGLGNGIYVIEPYPAKESKLLGYCWTDTWLFGYHMAARPDSKYGIFYGYGQGGNRLIDLSKPEKPTIAEYYLINTEWGVWIGDYLYAVKPPCLSGSINYGQIETWKIPVKDVANREKNAVKKGFVIYDMTNPIDPMLVYQYETEDPMGCVLVRGKYAYVLGNGADATKDKPAVDSQVLIFDISVPAQAKLIGKWSGYYDKGGMASPYMYLKGDYLLLPNNIIYHQEPYSKPPKGPRVIDVSDPANPKLASIISHWDETIGMNSMQGAQSFYIRGNRMYIADYWDGLHIFDISKGIEKAEWLACIKDKDHPWSCFSYCTSVYGYGKYIYTTNFGAVDIWEIPVPSDVPDGRMALWQKGEQR